MENLTYSSAGQGGPPYAPQPYATATAVAGAIPHPAPPPGPLPSTSPMAVLPYGVEIPNRVFVGGCPFSMTDQQLGEFFSKFGTIKDSKIIADRGTGRSKGYGFVTFATEEEAMNVHAMGSIFYNEKKLNLARAIRKCGGQFNRANQEYMNGQRAVWMHPGGYLIQQLDGNWHCEQYNAHSQPVKPCYPYYYPPPPAAQPPPFFVNGGGYSPVGNGTTFFPSTQPTQPEPSTNDVTDSEEASSLPATKSETATPEKKKKDSPDSDQLTDQLKQLSLDSAYTSETDIDSTTHSPVGESQAECSGNDDDLEEPPDLDMIVEVRKSPHLPRPQRHFPKRPPHFSLSSPPASHFSNGLYHPPTYFHPYPQMAPFNYPYTPQAAIQTIGPVYHGNQYHGN